MALAVFLVCLAASTIGGICGIGGGVVIKPVLDAMNIMSVSTVSFLSACTVLSMSLVSVWRNRKQLFDGGRTGTLLAIGAALGGVIGKLLFDLLKARLQQDAMIKLTQSVLLGLLTIGAFVYTLNKPRIRTHDLKNQPATALVGMALGLTSSFLGIGGGPFNLVVLHFAFGMDAKRAARNSLYIVLLSQLANLLQTIAGGKVPAFEWPMLLVMAGGGVLGGFLGTWVHRRISANHTERLFLGLLVVIFCICIYNAIRAIA